MRNKPRKETSSASRRGFVKKTAYTAPTLIVLGSLSINANANTDPGGSGVPGGPSSAAAEAARRDS